MRNCHAVSFLVTTQHSATSIYLPLIEFEINSLLLGKHKLELYCIALYLMVL